MEEFYRGTPTPVEEAINRVLRAEEEARQGVRECQAQAEGLLLAAHQQAAYIAVRTDRRISALHKRRAKLIKKQVQTLLEQGNSPQAEEIPQESDELMLRQAVVRLAAQWTGETDMLPPWDRL